jgi:hypothetical protein
MYQHGVLLESVMVVLDQLELGQMLHVSSIPTMLIFCGVLKISIGYIRISLESCRLVTHVGKGNKGVEGLKENRIKLLEIVQNMIVSYMSNTLHLHLLRRLIFQSNGAQYHHLLIHCRCLLYLKRIKHIWMT